VTGTRVDGGPGAAHAILRPMRPVIVFDLDGTLVDSLPDIVSSFLHAFEAARLPAPAEAAVWENLGQPLDSMFGRFAGAERIDELCRRYRTYYAGHLADRSRPYPGVVELLGELGQRGYLRVVASTKGTAIARRLVERVGLCDLLDHVEGTDAPPYKPAPDVVLRAIDAVAGRGAWMVGDTDGDVQAGRAAGLPTYAVTWGTQGDARLRAAAPTELAPDLGRLLALCPEPGALGAA